MNSPLLWVCQCIDVLGRFGLVSARYSLRAAWNWDDMIFSRKYIASSLVCRSIYYLQHVSIEFGIAPHGLLLRSRYTITLFKRLLPSFPGVACISLSVVMIRIIYERWASSRSISKFGEARSAAMFEARVHDLRSSIVDIPLARLTVGMRCWALWRNGDV